MVRQLAYLWNLRHMHISIFTNFATPTHRLSMEGHNPTGDTNTLQQICFSTLGFLHEVKVS